MFGYLPQIAGILGNPRRVAGRLHIHIPAGRFVACRCNSNRESSVPSAPQRARDRAGAASTRDTPANDGLHESKFT